MKCSLLVAIGLLTLAFAIAECSAEDGAAADLQKRQDDVRCGTAQTRDCQTALDSNNNDDFCDGNCLEVLTDYYHCLGFDEVRIERDEECGAMATAVAPVFFLSALLIALAAILY